MAPASGVAATHRCKKPAPSRINKNEETDFEPVSSEDEFTPDIPSDRCPSFVERHPA